MIVDLKKTVMLAAPHNNLAIAPFYFLLKNLVLLSLDHVMNQTHAPMHLSTFQF